MPAICVIPSDTATSKTKSKVEDCERKQIKANKIMTTKNQIQLNPKIAKVHSKINEKAMKNRDHDKNKLVNVVKDASKNKQIENNIAVEGRPKLRSKTKVNKHDRKSKSHKSIMCAKKIHKLKKNVKHVFKSLNDIDKQNIDVVLKKFNEDPTGSIKKRCNMLEQKVDDLMRYKKNRKRKIFINETVHYSNVIRNNKNYSIRKKVGEIVIHDYVPLPPKFSPCSLDNRVWDKIKNNPHKSSYDLVKTIFKTQETIEERNQITPRKKIHLSTLPKLPNTISAKPRYIEYEESSQMKPTINPRVDVEEGKQIAPSDDMQLSTLSNLPNDISLRVSNTKYEETPQIRTNVEPGVIIKERKQITHSEDMHLPTLSNLLNDISSKPSYTVQDETPPMPMLTRLTFESHNYDREKNGYQASHNYNKENDGNHRKKIQLYAVYQY
uniref:Uncharacterized protein n=1 Tax=Pectinophora gossypiella TaxID=13191 RepID=A0A1E1WL95_PECGO